MCRKNVTPGRRKGCPNYPPEFKQLLVAASCEPGISISKLALENGINANLLFKWRQQWREGKLLLPSSESPPATSCDSRCSCRTARIARRGPGNPQYQL
ncbi:transposase [Escherichia coli]|nr:transposase [Escherichia coli]MBW6101134.1 transposase [Escherichia coli]QJT88163.1 transposase [Escherichia coli]